MSLKVAISLHNRKTMNPPFFVPKSTRPSLRHVNHCHPRCLSVKRDHQRARQRKLLQPMSTRIKRLPLRSPTPDPTCPNLEAVQKLATAMTAVITYENDENSTNVDNITNNPGHKANHTALNHIQSNTTVHSKKMHKHYNSTPPASSPTERSPILPTIESTSSTSSLPLVLLLSAADVRRDADGDETFASLNT